MPLSEGEVIAGYTIVRSLGAGGMGEVYLAAHPRLPRHDALKLLAASVCADHEYRERFLREADIAAGLWHPHIVEVHDRGEVDGRLWISMDYVEGTDAERLLTERYPEGMPPALVLRLVTAVADALDYAHGKGLTHRDVKPANLLIANPDIADERILLSDFGIARRAGDTSNLTGTNMTVGTVAYAAPEQLTGDGVDGRADQYALAATAYQLLTGSPPFQHSNPAVVISAHLTSPAPPIGSRRPELSSLGPVFDKGLAKRPDERFAKCADFARALAHRVGTAPGDQGVTARSPVAEPRSSAAGPRHSQPRPAARAPKRRLLLTAGAVLATAAVAVGAFLAFGQPRPTSAVNPSRVALPVVIVGAACATLGGAGVTEAGAPAYCANMPSTNTDLWSLYQGQISKPTATAGPGDQVYPPDTEQPVLVCMQQTGASRADCHDDISRENANPGANDTLSPTSSPTST